jgi:hypothetical protein
MNRVVDLHKQAQDHLACRAYFWPGASAEEETQARADFIEEMLEMYGPEAAAATSEILDRLIAKGGM